MNYDDVLPDLAPSPPFTFDEESFSYTESLFTMATTPAASEAPACEAEQPEVPPAICTEPLVAAAGTGAPAIDPELLKALGDCYPELPEWGENIIDDIAQRWEPILKKGLKKELKEELNKQYLFPKNVPSSKAALLNPEVASVLTEPCKNRDDRLVAKQNQLGHALTALGKVMTGLLTKTMETPEVLKTLNDAGKLVADSHYCETDTRRSLITPLLDKSYVEPFKDRTRDSQLFGQNLGEFIKSSRGINKTGQLITPPATSASSNNLNGRGPPLQRQQQRPMRTPARRGGQRQPYPQRRAPAQPTRHQASMPPLPPARRPPRGPPPPPQRPAPFHSRNMRT